MTKTTGRIDRADMHPSDDLLRDLSSGVTSLAVIGLGYVGLPLAVAMGKHFKVIGYDRNQHRIDRLREGADETGEISAEQLQESRVKLTTDPSDIGAARFIIIAVPTPIDLAKQPDLAPLLGASQCVGRHIRRGSIVVFESTVYPGCTEEDCIPVIERESGLKAGLDFGYGYSPERINPGDRQHTFENIRKVVSGSDPAVLNAVASVYESAVRAGVFRASSVRVAEAAKVIENTQRDLNIALVNELALIFHQMGIDTDEVLKAAATKWNFLPFKPGLVGGHCIGVDPYYLTHKAESLGYHPQVILAGRRINDSMGMYVARECVRLLANVEFPIKRARILILGLTFKENVPDVRNTRVIDIVRELERYGAEAVVVDPVADRAEVQHEFGITLRQFDEVGTCEAVIFAVPHQEFLSVPLEAIAIHARNCSPFLDVKSIFEPAAVKSAGFTSWRL